MSDMPDRLLDPTRLVQVVRILRYPAGLRTVEVVRYWLALAIVAEAVHEDNTRSMWVKEL
jgi:hypothetical protein